MTRAEELFGVGDPEALFRGHPSALTPWPPAGQRKDRAAYRKDLVEDAVRNKQKTEPVDPRNLRSMQPNVTHAGVMHYWIHTELYADQNQAGNQVPVVYERDDDTRLLLSGTHRAVKALLMGQDLEAILVKGGWGDPR